MTKVLKILLQIVGGTIEWLLILLIFIAFAIRTSSFQTYLATKATDFLSEELKSKIKVDKVDILFFDKIELKGLLVLDLKKDTLASLESALLNFELKDFNLDSNVFVIDKISLNKGLINVYQEKKNGEFNFQFISDYFASTDTTASPPMELNLSKIQLSQIDLKFDDYRVAPAKFGLDYSHLAVQDLNLDADFKLLKSGGIATNIKNLSLKDQSGLEIDKLTSKISFNDKGLKMDQLKIYTPLSKIYFEKLNLLINNPNDFSEFVDKVIFDMDLKESLISLKDVSYFVPDLEGMDQKIVIQTQISKRIKDLKLANLDLRTGENTRIAGTVNLPDFRALEKAKFNEHLAVVNIDLKDIEKIKMPKSSKEKHLIFDETVSKFGQVKIKDLDLEGNYAQFVVKTDYISTNLGTIELDNGILISEQKNRSSFTFESTENSTYDVKIDTFQLGKMLSDNTIGSLSGQFFLNGEIFSSGKVDVNTIDGDVEHINLMGYNYNQITIENASFINNVFDGKITIKDENLDLTYQGFLDLNTNQHFNFTIDIENAALDRLNLSKVDTNILKSSFRIDISGTNSNNYSGHINLHALYYQEGLKTFKVPSLDINMNRSSSEDELTVNSSLADVYLKGKVDFATIGGEINNQLHRILPAFFTKQKLPAQKAINRFEYQLKVKEVNEILTLFSPGLIVSNGTTISGNYDGIQNIFNLNVSSSKIIYDKMIINQMMVKNSISDTLFEANYSIAKFHLSDSISVDNLHFTSNGFNNDINSELKWNSISNEASHFSWNTIVNDKSSFYFNINPSYFTVKNHRWDISQNSQILLAPNDIQIQNFKMQKENQYLLIDGCISEENEDELKVAIKDLELDDFSNILGLSTKIKGNLNGEATVSDPFNDVAFSSDFQVKDLFIDDAEVGDINLKGAWGKKTESIDLSGELFYKKNKTFNFDGKYYLARKENLDFNLKFDYMDLQMTNAFMDPQVLSGIRGLVEGGIKITGSSDNPQIEGDINLLGGNAKVGMVGVNFGFDGKIKIEKDGFFIDNMPIMDEEGNAGTLNATVFHQNFQDMSFDIAFNLEDDAFNRGQNLPRFLVLNTNYKEGDVYYGKAFVTGTAAVSGYANNMQIDVNLETQKGSKINFPMYGTSEITEDQFITFKSKDTLSIVQHKINFSGVNLNLNFKVTPEAQLKIIFDENTGDEITAFGNGDIGISMNSIGDLSMLGVFEISKGSVYNFVMGPVKQPFFIEEGGTISWTGDPVNAILDLKTYNIVKTSLSDIMPTIEEGAQYPIQDVKCYLNLSSTLSEPQINFDIELTKATENDKAALNRVKGDKDELNKQFFSLLLVKKFQPINGNLSAGSGAGLDLVSSQLNDMLNKVSSDVKFNVALANSKEEKSAAFGVQKNLLNDRLILKGSLGVENSASSSQNPNSVIGDVNIEYLINEKGTFRVSIFNESNDNTVIQEKSQGQFTQGAGINYLEDFNTIHDFEMVQYMLDAFRSQDKKRYPIKRKKERKEIPTISSTLPLNKPEE